MEKEEPVVPITPASKLCTKDTLDQALSNLIDDINRALIGKPMGCAKYYLRLRQSYPPDLKEKAINAFKEAGWKSMDFNNRFSGRETEICLTSPLDISPEVRLGGAA